MVNKILIWFQLLSALMLLIDAYIPYAKVLEWNKKLLEKALSFHNEYKELHLNEDMENFQIFLICFLGFPTITSLNLRWREYLWQSGSFGVLIVISMGIVSCWLLVRTCYQVRYLKDYLNLMILYPICSLLCKSLKGPIYTLGFILLVSSHIIQLYFEYTR